MSRTWVIVVAAGSGSRFGGAKQFEVVNGERVLDRSVATADAVADGVVVVASADHLDRVPPLPAGVLVVAGGATRSASVRCGLAAVPHDVDVVLVHDAARPLASPELYQRVVAAVRSGADAAVPGVPVVDTIKRVGGAEADPQRSVVETVDRSELVAVQTPQGFAARALRAAHAGSPDASDDAGLIEAAGGSVVVVPGERTNMKITVPQDLAIMQAIAR